MARRKYDYPDRAGYHEALKQSLDHNMAMRIGLDAIINGDIEKWFEKGKYKVGVIGSTRGDGGYLLYQYQMSDSKIQSQVVSIDDVMSTYSAHEEELRRILTEVRYYREAELKKLEW